MDIRIPLFHDEHTPEFEGKEAFLPPPPGASLPGCPGSPAQGHASVCSRLESVNETETVVEPCVQPDTKVDAAEEGQEVNGPHVHMDAMAFGMGCCCLQVTFQVSCSYWLTAVGILGSPIFCSIPCVSEYSMFKVRPWWRRTVMTGVRFYELALYV